MDMNQEGLRLLPKKLYHQMPSPLSSPPSCSSSLSPQNSQMGPSGTEGKTIISTFCIATAKPMATDTCRKSGRQCCCLGKLVTTLKKCGKMVNKSRSSSSSRQTSFQCCYDPLSYSLNFDSGGRGSNYEDYHQFCAFKNRFLASPTVASAAPALADSH